MLVRQPGETSELPAAATATAAQEPSSPSPGCPRLAARAGVPGARSGGTGSGLAR